MATPLPSSEYLRERISYNPITGAAVWQEKRMPDALSQDAWTKSYVSRWNKRRAGRPAGTGKRKIHVTIDGRRLLLHRVIWKIMTGQEPDCIDHIDGNQSNNRWANLRNVDQRTNNKNTRRRTDNTSGCAGVTFDRARNKWAAEIQDGGVRRHLGRFATFEEARLVRRKAQAAKGFTARHGQEAVP